MEIPTGYFSSASVGIRVNPGTSAGEFENKNDQDEFGASRSVVPKGVGERINSGTLVEEFEPKEVCELPTVANEFVDKISLEFLMNKNHYNRYISQTDPKRHSEIQEHLANVRKYKRNILQMTSDLLENPNKQITHEIGDIFDAYVKTMIKHFKMKELEGENNYNKSEEDDDVLFGASRSKGNGSVGERLNSFATAPEFGSMSESECSNSFDNVPFATEFTQYPVQTMKSFWGNERVVKRTDSELPEGGSRRSLKKMQNKMDYYNRG